MGDESDAHANGAAGLHVVDLDEAESFVDGDGGAAPPNLVPPSLTIEPGGPDALGKYGADALTKPSDGGEGTTGGEPSREHQEISLFMVVKGFPKFRETRRASMWDELNDLSPSSRSRPGPFKSCMLRLAGDPNRAPSATNGKPLEVVVILCILLNTLILAIQHPSNTYSDELNHVMNVMDIVLTCIFTLEMFIKIFAYGMVKGSNEIPCYLSDGWNRLDFVVVLISWLAIIVEVLELQLPIKVSTLRALRIMRVLKSLRFFTGIKMILVTLAKAAADMTTILGFLAFVFTIAGIVGIQMFRGTINWRCSKVAPVPDASGFDWIPLGIGETTYRKHCIPDLERPRCPEFPPCNVLYDRFTLDPILDTRDNGMLWGVPKFEIDGARKRGWIERSAGWEGNSTGGQLLKVYDDPAVYNADGGTCTGTATNQSQTCDYDPSTDPHLERSCPVGCAEAAGSPPEYTSSTGERHQTTSDLTKVAWARYGDVVAASHSALNRSFIAGQSVGPRAQGEDVQGSFQESFEYTERCPPCYAPQEDICSADESCYEYGNPGLGYHGFDNIVMSWLTIFIEMANLYWWETGYRTLDTSVGLSAEIAYEFGFIIVFVLSMVSVNMFVAVITDTFGTVRAAEDLIDLIDKKVQVKLTVVAKNANPPKHTSVPGKPYTVYVGLSGDSTVGDVKKTFQRHFLERDVIDRHLCAYENDSKNADDLDLKIGDFLDDTKVIADLEDDQLLAVTMLEQKEEVGPTVDPQLVRDSEVQSTAPGKGIEVFDPDQKTRCKRPNGTVVYQIWEDTVALSDNDKYQGGVDDDGNKKMVTVKRLLELHHKPPRYRVKCCSNLVTKTSFDSFIMAFILLNTLTLASEHFMMDESLVTFLGNVGHIFNLVFTFEMISKMLGMGVKNYLAIPFNRLDCFIVLTSLLNYLGDVLPGASVARLLRVFRLFRVARVIRILYKYESMKRLLNTVMGSGVALANLTLFILFTVTIFGIFGMHLFGGAYPTEGCVEAVIADGKPESFSVAVDKAACEAVDVSGDSIIEEQAVCEAVMTAAVDDGAQRACKYVTELALPRRSFEHFGVAWMMAFQTLTGDDWCNQMYQTMNVAGAFLPAMVFGLCFVCCNYILTNLFIAVILENFEIAEKTKKRKQQKMDALEKKEKVLEEIVNRADTEWQDEMKELNDAEVLTDGKFGKLQFDVGTKTMLIVADDGAPSQAVDYDGVGRLISEAAEERMRQKAAAAGGGGSRRDGRRMEVLDMGVLPTNSRPRGPSNRRRGASVKVTGADDDGEEVEEEPVGCETFLCRNPVLWCCRGCRRNDCRKKTRNERKAERRNPEDRTKFCCHNPDAICGITQDNDTSLFLFHGRTATYMREETDEYGDKEEIFEECYTNSVRRFFQVVEANKWFERSVMIAILVSSILLAYEGPAESMEGLEVWDDYLVTDLLKTLDTCFYGVFMFEFFTKIIHRGFIFTPNAYLSDAWNRLDFVVVLFSTMNYMPGQEKSSLGRVFRLGRCLRPLRMVNKNPGLKVIVTAVMKSLGTNLGVMALAGMLFLIFGILGTNLFGGTFWSCTCGDVVGSDVWAASCTACLEEHWPNITDYRQVPATAARLAADPNWVSESAADNVTCVHLCDNMYYRMTDGSAHQYKPVELCDAKTFMQKVATTGSCGEWVLGENDRQLCEVSTFLDDMLGETKQCEWVQKRYNFDDIGQAFMAMFTAATLAGWTDIMEASMDANSWDQQPETNAAAAAAIYWVLFVFLNAFFITNLFVGVLVDYIAQSDGSALQTEEQAQWTDMQRLISELRPDISAPIPPKNPIRKHSLHAVLSPQWGQTSNACIVLNVFVMCLEFQYQPLGYENALEYINNGFLIFFTIEMGLKLVGMGPSRYWMDMWNRFDAIVVSASWLGMWLNIQVQVARAFRAFRIVLVLKNAKGLQALFKCLIWAIVPSMNIGMLLCLQFSLFAILGMQILGKPSGPHFDEVPDIFPGSLGGTVGHHQSYLLSELGQTQQTMDTNFKSYWGAMKLLFECATGKDWKIVMYEVYDVVPGFAFPYFFFHYFLCVYILCNLFVAVIIDTFNSAGRELPCTPDHMEVFQNCWKAHAIRERELLKNQPRVLNAMGPMDMFIRMRPESEISAPKGSAEYYEEKWSSVISLLQDVGRFKGEGEALKKQRLLEAKVARINDLIYEAKVAEAKGLMSELEGEENKKLLTSTLSKDVALWGILVRPMDPDIGQAGLGGTGGLTKEVLEKWDSFRLCAHPDRPDDEITRKGEEVWETWFKRFLVELEVRWKVKENRFIEKTQATSCIGRIFGDAQEFEDMEGAFVPTRDNMVGYDAVLEALVLTASGDGAKTKEELDAANAEQERIELHTTPAADLEKKAELLDLEIAAIEAELMDA